MRFLTPEELLHDSWRLAAAVRNAGWRPDFLLALWRGGAPVGVAVHEFLKASGWDLPHLPLKSASYTGIGENSGTVDFPLGDAVFQAIPHGAKVLLVDDVFDSGRTAKAAIDRLAAIGADPKIACPYWKPANNATSIKPDYFVCELDSEWIVFPHEIEGLSADQIMRKAPLLAELLAGY